MKLALALMLYALPALAEEAAAPPPAAAPREVVVGTYLNTLSALDLKNDQFTVDFYIWFRWEGDDLHPLETFELPGGRILSRTALDKKKLGTQNYRSARVIATITHVWHLRRFPLDGHTIALEVEDAENDARAITYRYDADNSGISPDLQVPGWVVTGSQGQVERHGYHTNYGDTSYPTNRESAYSRYRFTLQVERPGYGRFWKVFFGLFISVLISWCAFWVPRDSSTRVSLGVGATFATSAISVNINNMLPDTNSVTMADKLVWLTLGLIVLSLADSVIALSLFAKHKEGALARMDRVSRWAFPLAYLLGLLLIIKL